MGQGPAQLGRGAPGRVGGGLGLFTRLAFLGILNSLIGLYYYLKVPIELYAKAAPADRTFRFPARDRAFSVVVVGAVFATVWFGIGPTIEPALVMMKNAFESLG